MISSHGPVIVWLRNDLRLADNPALTAAVESGRQIICLYVLDEETSGFRPLGGASKWWLQHSLAQLSEGLERIGGRLDILSGSAASLINKLVQATSASAIFWNRRYGAAEIAADTAIKAELLTRGVQATSFNSHLLTEPWEVKNKTGGAFKVFTPFWRTCLAQRHWPTPLATPTRLQVADYPSNAPERVSVEALGLLPTAPDWAGGLRDLWQPGESGAIGRIQDFLDKGIRNYGEDRNRPDLPGTSSLSPHLRFGEISPRQIVRSVEAGVANGNIPAHDGAKFLSEIGWREFSYHLLFHNPDLATRNFSAKFDTFPWADPRSDLLKSWQHGRTGYPIVDAGMRQLWQTGYMHNRVRMITASFLTKHLLIDWRVGEAWFWDTLCDADPANNSASWQWVAGCGADAAPYFRIFNPVLQGEKFDPNGDYVRRFVPEIDRIPNQWLHKPWEAPPTVLRQAGIQLGHTYPRPIVDHSAARQGALAAFASLVN